jgi:DNA-binding MarR family transcriptional regulator
LTSDPTPLGSKHLVYKYFVSKEFSMLKREQMLCFSLGVAMRRITRIYAEALAAHDITPPQLFLLSCLGRSDGLKPSELAEQICLDSSSLTGLLDRTEKAGLVRREPDPSDRRALRVYLTGLGTKRLNDLEPIVESLQAKIHDEFFSGFPPEQVAMFHRMLQQVREVAT